MFHNFSIYFEQALPFYLLNVYMLYFNKNIRKRRWSIKFEDKFWLNLGLVVVAGAFHPCDMELKVLKLSLSLAT